MKVVSGKESTAIHDLYDSMTDVLLNAPVDSHMALSVLLKVVAVVALHEEWERDELLQALAYTYDLEKFMNPTSKEKH